MLKTCSRCKHTRELGDFYADKRARDGKQSQCKGCMRAAARTRDFGVQYERTGRASHLRRKFGLSTKQYDDLVAAQDGACAGCGRRPTPRLHVDHDHETGLVRGLLCTECNRALGLIRDNPATLRRLAAYLEVGRLGTAEGMLSAMRGLLGVSGRPNLVTRDYAKRHGDTFLEAPWCDMSITYAARGSGNAAAVLPNGDRAFTVWHAEDGQKLGRWYAGTAANIRLHARPGAVVFFDWDGTDRISAIDHVGIVEVNLGDGRVQTIEANTGDACKRRVRGSSVIAGFWNPNYESKEDDDVSAKDLWDHELKVPFGSKENPEWQAGNLLVNVAKWELENRASLAAINAKLDAQNVTIKALADALAQRDGAVDADALVARIEAAIEGITVRLDVPNPTV